MPSYDVVFINERMEDHADLPRDGFKIEPLDATADNRLSGGTIGTDGYYLTRKGAECLLEKAREAKFYGFVGGFIVDAGLGRHGATDAKFGIVTPSLVREYADILYK